MTLFIEDSFVAPLSQAVQKEYNQLILLLSQVPNTLRSIKKIEGTGGLVSVADLIAYQIGWGKLLISWYTAGLQQKMPKMPGEGFPTWDYSGLANHFYKKYAYDNGDQQEKEFYNVVQKVLTIIEKEHHNGNLDKEGVWAWCTLPSGKQWPLNKWIKVNTVAPYKRASGLIRKFIKV